MYKKNPEITYRTLHHEEIGQLIHQGCISDDWNNVRVANGFLPDNIQNSKFTGKVYLDSFDGTVKLTGGIIFKTGIYNA